jgi:hypothetical protein
MGMFFVMFPIGKAKRREDELEAIYLYWRRQRIEEEK